MNETHFAAGVEFIVENGGRGGRAAQEGVKWVGDSFAARFDHPRLARQSGQARRKPLYRPSRGLVHGRAARPPRDRRGYGHVQSSQQNRNASAGPARARGVALISRGKIGSASYGATPQAEGACPSPGPRRRAPAM